MPNNAWATAKAHWDRMPDWILALAEECDRTSQAATARALGFSPASVSLALRNTYPASLKKLEQAVRGTLMRKTVDCPVCGELNLKDCLKHQAAKFAATNPTRVELYRACRNGCPHSKLEAS